MPALPQQWPTGKVQGLCARGGFVVDIKWHRGQLARATIRAKIGGFCGVCAQTSIVLGCNGQQVQTGQTRSGVLEFDTESDNLYTLSSL